MYNVQLYYFVLFDTINLSDHFFFLLVLIPGVTVLPEKDLGHFLEPIGE